MRRDTMADVAAKLQTVDHQVGRLYGLAKAGIAGIGLAFGLGALWTAKAILSGWPFFASAAAAGGLILYCLYHAYDGLFGRHRASALLANEVRSRLSPIEKALRIAGYVLPWLRRKQA